MSTLGSRLLELRKQKGFTQEQLAEKLNVTNQSVSKWEKDINAPDITLLVELADLLASSFWTRPPPSRTRRMRTRSRGPSWPSQKERPCW